MESQHGFDGAPGVWPRAVVVRRLLAPAAAASLVVALLAATRSGPAVAVDDQALLPAAKPGTPFFFEVVESQDAKYLGDTPSHLGRDGGLKVRPRVALGDPVYRTVDSTTRRIGTVTMVAWNRVSGSLTVEFDPQPFERIAVGDEVWVDLNPSPSAPPPGPTSAGPVRAAAE